jgi:hypothetical protein
MSEKPASPSATGRCLCGAVHYEVRGPLRSVVACHCSQCRRFTGHFAAASAVYARDLSVNESGALTWYRSSEEAERGFCSGCGSSLFWRRVDGDEISIMAGTIDLPTGLGTVLHMCVGDASDYCDLPVDVPTTDQHWHSVKIDDG